MLIYMETSKRDIGDRLMIAELQFLGGRLSQAEDLLREAREALAEQVRQAKYYDLTQVEIAAFAGVTRDSVRKWQAAEPPAK